METREYRVQLDSYVGPLDLLLYLVRRNELAINDLPIAKITAQFQEFMEVLEFLDLDQIGEFVVMASTLVEIKSRLVLPQPEEEVEPEITADPSSELVEQLLQYKKFKDASNALEERAAQWQERYPRLSDDRPRVTKMPAADRIKEVELWDLVSALSRVIRTKVVEREAKIRYDDTPISVYVEKIAQRVHRDERVAFTSFFDETTLRSKIVGMFLAILELLRHHSYRAEQPDDFGEIWVLPPEIPRDTDPVHGIDTSEISSYGAEPAVESEESDDEPPATDDA